MNIRTSKGVTRIEEQMESLSPESFRYKILSAAKNFKSSWMELGQHLFSVYRDKLFRDWGYLTFETYCSKEIGIRQPTAMKLLKSYSFLEREEPAFLKQKSNEDTRPAQIPSYEVVNALRLAKENKKVPEEEYADLREAVLQSDKDDETVRKKIRYVLKTRNTEHESGGAKPEERRKLLITKLLSQLKTSRDEMVNLDFPKKLIREIDMLIQALLDQ